MDAEEHHARALLRSLIDAGAVADSTLPTAQLEQWAEAGDLDKDDLDAALDFARRRGWIAQSAAGTIKLTRAGYDDGASGPQDA